MYFGTPLYWRETHKQPRFLIFDGRIVVVLLTVILYVRIWTILLALSVMIVLFIFDRKGVPADSILRFMRSWVVGRRRSARGATAERLPVDFGFETRAMVSATMPAMAKPSPSAAKGSIPRRSWTGLLPFSGGKHG